MQNKGFTLIELLVVIAIIGILSGIIIVSMGSAQKSAQDAKIQATMDQMRTAAQMFYLNNNTYTGLDGAGTDYTKLGASLTVVPATTIASTAFCAHVPLTADTTKSWCVDSNGNAKSVTTTAITTSNCTSTTAPVCP
ncbi:prepilin-type N-terminal cleavage/methylation domain-containing protein [bacterium]|nr:prepilin-type N-terminal cleavage/methylation domain-containing protein [bacterium]